MNIYIRVLNKNWFWRKQDVLRPEDKLDQSAAWYELFLTAIGLTTDG
jgi:hypothetical protein